MLIELRDGTKAESPMVDALESFDERSRDFDVTQALAALSISSTLEPINKIHLNPTLLDQAGTGGCCAFSGTHFMLCEPAMGNPNVYTAEFAKEKLYFPAQKIDKFPGGEYPGANPIMQGTSLLSVLKIMLSEGLISSYEWSFNFMSLVLGLGYIGPALIATVWTEGMAETTSTGEASPYGRALGRHAYVAYGIDVKKKRILFANSHGPSYGIQGRFWMTFPNVQKLVKARGEVVFPTKRR